MNWIITDNILEEFTFCAKAILFYKFSLRSSTTHSASNEPTSTSLVFICRTIFFFAIIGYITPALEMIYDHGFI